MTYVYEKHFGKFDSSTNFEGNKLIVEYVHSSVSDSIKVVEMWVNGKFHRVNWMSPEGNKMLMARLDADMTNRMCGTRADAGLNDDGDSYVDNLLTTGFDTEVDLDRDVPPVVSALTGGE